MIASPSQRYETDQRNLANIEVEKAVLGSLIAGGRGLIDKLGVEAVDLNLFFYSQSHKILAAIAELYDKGAPYDLQIVTEQLHQQGTLEAVGGPAAITSLGVDGNSDLDITRYNLGLLRDLEVKRRTARVAERMQRGDIDPEQARKMLDEITRYSHDAAKPLIEFRSPLELKNFTPPPGIVLVGDCHIVKRSVFVIDGPPGVGKSRSAVTLAVAGATGHDWFGLTVHRIFKTMIVQTENGEFRLAREFRELDCDALENFVRVCPPPPYGLCFRRDDFRTQLEAAIADFAPDVVVYDPWNAAAREQDSREYLDTFDALKSVLPIGDNAPALGIVAHTRKPKTDERASGRAMLNLLAGSYVLGSVPRTVFVMQAASDDTTDNRVVWTCCKNNDGELGERLAWERRNGLFAPVVDFDWEAFDNPHPDNRVTIIADHMAEIFENGAKELRRADAAKALQALTGAGRTACYNALRPDGRFAKNLSETNGLLSWKT
jgi:hypothetical protein